MFIFFIFVVYNFRLGIFLDNTYKYRHCNLVNSIIQIFLYIYFVNNVFIELFFSSIAILRYLCRTYNVADHWYPKDYKKQARIDEYLEWQHNNTRAHCTEYFRNKVTMRSQYIFLVSTNKILFYSVGITAT